MNKKFSTLVASFLLAGGLFSAANATNIKDAVKGQYYNLVQTASFNDRAWTSADTKIDGQWTIETKTTANGTEVRLVNVETGKALTATGANEKTVEWFILSNYIKAGEVKNDFSTSVVNQNADINLLSCAIDGEVKLLQEIKDGKAVFTKVGTSHIGLNIVEVAPVVWEAEQLNAIEGNGFHVTVGYQPIKSNGALDTDKKPVAYTLQGNVFDGHLFAEKTTNGVALYLGNKDGKRIVLTKNVWENVANSDASYKFTTLTTAQLSTATNVFADEFVINVPQNTASASIEIKTEVVGGKQYELRVTGVNGTYYLTVGEDIASGKAGYTYTESKCADNTYVWFGASNEIEYSIFYDKVLNITRVHENGSATEVASPNCAKDASDYIPVAQIALNQPEGQWLWNGSAFVNRESGNPLEIKSLRSTDTENVYINGDGYYYTINAVGTPGDNGYNGYFAAYTDDQLKKKALLIGTPLVATGDTVYMTLGEDNEIKFTTEKAEAIEFRFTKVANAKYGSTVKHFTVYQGLNSKKEVVNKVDTLNFYRYNLTDAVSKKHLVYDSENNRFALTGDASAYTVVLKGKKNEDYNILAVWSDAIKKMDKDEVFTGIKASSNQFVADDKAFCAKMSKFYGAHNVNELKCFYGTYQYTENDVFVISEADAYQYRPVNAMDTIKIYRNDDNSYVLYEKGALLKDANDEVLEGFLGLENFLDPQYSKKNPAMIADTAAGYGTWRPQYLLALDATVVPAGKYCDIHGVDAGCKDEHLTDTEGYIEGRYLVNLVDSAKAGRKDCVYQNYAGNNYYRLGFVQAKHIGDSLIIASSNEKIVLNDNTTDEFATFAFRYVDANRDAFIIETLYDKTYYTHSGADYNKGDLKDKTTGYVKFHNGIPVVTSQVSEAEVFDLEVLTDVIPTANETIAASAVTVVAGEGNVTIAGAAGKKVVIANILGQTIANTVLTSDNATIAAPAGVVVVAVEGEAAVKAIVK